MIFKFFLRIEESSLQLKWHKTGKIVIAMRKITFQPKETISTEKYVMRIDPQNCFMEYTIRPGIIFEAEDAIEAKTKIVARYPGMKFFVLAEGIEFFTMTKKARELCATKEHLDNTHCIAFCTGNTSIYLLGELFNKINKPFVPTKFFFNKQQAHDWLQGQMKKHSPAH
jgi:hypothetical protein